MLRGQAVVEGDHERGERGGGALAEGVVEEEVRAEEHEAAAVEVEQHRELGLRRGAAGEVEAEPGALGLVEQDVLGDDGGGFGASCVGGDEGDHGPRHGAVRVFDYPEEYALALWCITTSSSSSSTLLHCSYKTLGCGRMIFFYTISGL
ncbi:putative carboxylesterase 8 [Iris pallida]|uniref:Carboxylesterase 8 n=1 Tax=Iris pallida TaxID=29817 RepID=A0AAX6GT14_IRIPA|nr:putative carboxylesterase 8 [Iris pallida]